jgi:hypothetical protein
LKELSFQQKKALSQPRAQVSPFDPKSLTPPPDLASAWDEFGASPLHLGDGTANVVNLDDLGETELAPPPAARWRYAISTGQLYDDGQPFGPRGYAGTGKGRNNPAMVKEKFVGPLPPGRYSIGGAYRNPALGPLTMDLKPLEGTEMHGRDLFRIHGDNKAGDASKGCIVLPPDIRAAIARAGGDLDVTLD